MKSKNLYIFLFILIVFPYKLNAQWVQTGGPQGSGDYVCLERVGNNIWSGGSTGIYISYNEGASWQKSPLINNDICKDIKAFNDTVIVIYLTYDPNIAEYNFCSILSIDGGISFTAPSVIESYASLITSSYLFKGLNTLIVKGAWDYFISHDWGLNWSLMTFPNGNGMNFKWSDDSQILIECLNNGGPAGLYLSSDGTQSWTVVDSIHYYVSSVLLDDSVLFESVNYADSVWHTILVRSNDYGATWDTISYFPLGVQEAILSRFQGNLYAYTLYSDMYPTYLISYDNGFTWGAAPLPPGYLLSDLLLSNGDYLSYVNTYGIVRYVTSQNTFFTTETGMKSETINYLNSHNGILYTATSNDTYRSTDGGLTWSPIPIPYKQVDDFAFLGDTILCINEGYISGIARSFDNGVSGCTCNWFILVQYNMFRRTKW